jgi:hypothetical protein
VVDAQDVVVNATKSSENETKISNRILFKSEEEPIVTENIDTEFQDIVESLKTLDSNFAEEFIKIDEYVNSATNSEERTTRLKQVGDLLQSVPYFQWTSENTKKLKRDLPELWEAVRDGFEKQLHSTEPSPHSMLNAAFFLRRTVENAPGFTRASSEVIPYLEELSEAVDLSLNDRAYALDLLEDVYRGLGWNEFARNGNKPDPLYSELSLHFREMKHEAYRKLGWEDRCDDCILESLMYAGRFDEVQKEIDLIRESDDRIRAIGQLNLLGYEGMSAILRGEKAQAFEYLNDALIALPDHVAINSERGFPYLIWHLSYRLAVEDKEIIINKLRATGSEKPNLTPVMDWMVKYIEEGRSRWNSKTTPHRPFMDLAMDEPVAYTDEWTYEQAWKDLHDSWSSR